VNQSRWYELSSIAANGIAMGCGAFLQEMFHGEG